RLLRRREIAAVRQHEGVGADLDEAVRRGCAAGALATTRMGAQSAMPTGAELNLFLAAQEATARA
ncbi:hypothetical protein AB0H87_41605, partial [Asanoa sp. NPDC050611]